MLLPANEVTKRKCFHTSLSQSSFGLERVCLPSMHHKSYDSRVGFPSFITCHMTGESTSSVVFVSRRRFVSALRDTWDNYCIRSSSKWYASYLNAFLPYLNEHLPKYLHFQISSSQKNIVHLWSPLKVYEKCNWFYHLITNPKLSSNT